MRTPLIPGRCLADRLIAAGVGAFAIGALATLVTLACALLRLGHLPTAAYLVSMAMPVGLAAALIGMTLDARRQRQALVSAADAGAVSEQRRT